MATLLEMRAYSRGEDMVGVNATVRSNYFATPTLFAKQTVMESHVPQSSSIRGAMILLSTPSFLWTSVQMRQRGATAGEVLAAHEVSRSDSSRIDFETHSDLSEEFTALQEADEDVTANMPGSGILLLASSF